MKHLLIFIIFFTSSAWVYAEYEPYEGPEMDNHPKDSRFPGLKLIELYNAESKTVGEHFEGYRPKTFTGYTLIQIEDTPLTRQRSSNTAIAAMEKILRGAEQSYLDLHKEKGSIPHEMLDSVSKSPDRFIDHRSVYTLIVEGSAQDVVRWVMQSQEFPKEHFLASLRISKASYEYPMLPFAMNLGKNPPTIPDQLTTKHLREGFITNHTLTSSPNPPYTQLTSYKYDVELKQGVALGGANEVKAFMIKRSPTGSTVDWFPFLVQFLEQQSLSDRSGHVLDRKTGKVYLQGDPLVESIEDLKKIVEKEMTDSLKEKRPTSDTIREINRELYAWQKGFLGQKFQESLRFGPIFASEFYAEVILSTEEFSRYVTEKKPTGLLKMYTRMGFEVDLSSTKPHPSHPQLTIAVLKISRDNWSRAVIGTSKRPGMKNLNATIEHIRSFPLIMESQKLTTKIPMGPPFCRDIF